MDPRDVGTDSEVFDKNMEMLLNTKLGSEIKEAILILFMYHHNVIAEIIMNLNNIKYGGYYGR